MTDQTVQPDVARTAYAMALEMWRESNGRGMPSVDDTPKFLALVNECARALKGNTNYTVNIDWMD
jgi:hypothetical protein